MAKERLAKKKEEEKKQKEEAEAELQRIIEEQEKLKSFLKVGIKNKLDATQKTKKKDPQDPSSPTNNKEGKTTDLLMPVGDISDDEADVLNYLAQGKNNKKTKKQK